MLVTRRGGLRDDGMAVGVFTERGGSRKSAASDTCFLLSKTAEVWRSYEKGRSFSLIGQGIGVLF